jgi:probable rRNA maturation factor
MAEAAPSPAGAQRRSNERLDVALLRQSPLWEQAALSDALIADAVRAAFDSARRMPHGLCGVTILLADDATLRELNRGWRGKDAPTNVLSFPSGLLGAPWDVLANEPRPLGDVAIAVETAAAEAATSGIPLPHHVVHLVVHGVLHLLGFDHKAEADAVRMENLERQVLARFGIPNPYADETELAIIEASR